MKFLHLFRHRAREDFGDIEGYDDLKDVIRRALDCEHNINILLSGPPASSKTLFLLGIMEREKKAVYFDGSNTTNRILDVLDEERPKIICLDEFDKMGRNFQNQLLNFMESGRVKVDQQRRQYDFEIKGAKVFATANEIDRLSKPLQSRFRRLHLPRYTKDQFLNVAIKVCPKSQDKVAEMIGEEVWKSEGGDIRDVISISKLIRKNDGREEIKQIMMILSKYGKKMDKSHKVSIQFRRNRVAEDMLLDLKM
jgi:DNA polymerase III delta prime subunit